MLQPPSGSFDAGKVASSTVCAGDLQGALSGPEKKSARHHVGRCQLLRACGGPEQPARPYFSMMVLTSAQHMLRCLHTPLCKDSSAEHEEASRLAAGAELDRL